MLYLGSSFVLWATTCFATATISICPFQPLQCLNPPLAFSGSRTLSNKSVKTDATTQEKIRKVLDLLRQRLLIQNQVARWKWNSHSPIEAPQREQEILLRLRQEAPNYQLHPDQVAAFFQWQFQAGKLIQINHFQTWQRQGEGSFASVPDLNQTLRPRLNDLDRQLLILLAELAPQLTCASTQALVQTQAEKIIQGEGIDQIVRQVAIAPLLAERSRPC